MGMGDSAEHRVRQQLAGLTRREKLVGCDHLAHDLTAVQISALRGIPLRTVERAIAAVKAAVRRAGVELKPFRSSTRHASRGFTPTLALAL